MFEWGVHVYPRKTVIDMEFDVPNSAEEDKELLVDSLNEVRIVFMRRIQTILQLFPLNVDGL